MICPHWQCEKCVTIGYNEPKQVYDIIRKWIENKWNVSVIGRANNQTFITKLAQYWRCDYMTFEGTSTKNVANFWLCKWSIEITCKWKYDCIVQPFPKGGHENKQPKVVKLGYFVMLHGKEKCQFPNVPLHQVE
jgi:hypothetical protein